MRSILRQAYRRRSEVRSDEQQRRSARTDNFNRWSTILIPLVAVLLAVIFMAAGDADSAGWRLMVAAFAGGVGSTLSGVLQLRDVWQLTQLRELRTGLIAQPLTGAVAAVFLFLLLEGHVLVLPGAEAVHPQTWGVVGTYGFLAGFSEPFFLGAVRRAAGGSGGPRESASGRKGRQNRDAH